MELLIIFLLAILNGVMAMSEVAVIAARKTRLKQRVLEGDKAAGKALALAEEPNRFLSTVQIGITLIGVLAGAFGGATIASDFAAGYASVEPLEPYANALGVGTVVAITTYLSLVVGELVPKRLAIQHPETIASFIAPLMSILSTLMAPLVWLLGVSTDAVLRLLGAQESDEPEMTQEEIQVMLREGHREGIIEQYEHEMVEGVFRLTSLSAASLMTPRLEITWLDLNDSPEQWLETVLQTPHHRLPVKDDSMEQIVGIVKTKRVLQALTQESDINLKALAQLPIFIPETLRAPEILSRLRTSESKMAVVISEHGGVEGIITIQDVLEAIVGELEAPEAIQRDDDSWLVDGLMPIAEFKPLVGLDALPDEEKYQTLAGFVIAYTGRIPAAGDKFVWNNTEFEVIDMDGNRVDKVLVCRLPEPDAESTEMEV